MAGKRYRSDLEKATSDPVPLIEAVNRVKAMKKLKFDQTVNLCVHLGIDPKQADQQLRGAISLPNGIGGDPKRVIAFVSHGEGRGRHRGRCDPRRAPKTW